MVSSAGAVARVCRHTCGPAVDRAARGPTVGKTEKALLDRMDAEQRVAGCLVPKPADLFIGLRP